MKNISNHLDRVCQHCGNTMRDGSLRETGNDERVAIVHDHYDIFADGCPNICGQVVGRYSTGYTRPSALDRYFAQMTKEISALKQS